MKILVLQGSPRRAGNTQSVLAPLLEGAREAGAETETILLSELTNLTGCMECYACRSHMDEPGCVIKDDMQSVLHKAIEADRIVFATPVFCWTVAWPLKLAMDRMYCTFKFDEHGAPGRHLLSGKKLAAVVTAADFESGGADLAIETCRRMAEFGNMEWAGAFFAGRLSTPEATRADKNHMQRAREFGRELAR